MLMPAANVSINFDAFDITGDGFFPFAFLAILLPATRRHCFRFPHNFLCAVPGMVNKWSRLIFLTFPCPVVSNKQIQKKEKEIDEK